MPRLKGSADLLEDRRKRAFGVAGFGLFSQRSGAAHRMPCQFGDALA